MSIVVSDVRIGCRALRHNHQLFVDFSLESDQSANIQSSISASCLVFVFSKGPRCVLEGSSRSHHVLSQHHQASVIHCPLFVESHPERNSSILTVSSMYHQCILKVLSEHCQKLHHCTVTASSQHHPDHQAHCQTGIRAASNLS